MIEQNDEDGESRKIDSVECCPTVAGLLVFSWITCFDTEYLVCR